MSQQNGAATLNHIGAQCGEQKRRTIMKIILSTVVALSVLAGIAGSANAVDPQRGVWGQFSTGQGGGN
jgi:hypothetical protein